MIIQHNMPSMFANRNLKITTGDYAKTSERLASGYRINRAADDAAGLSISEKLRSLVRGHNRAAANVMDGISLLQVADGALNEVHDMLHRMSELAIQAANDTNTDDDRENLQDEIDAIKNEINRISTDTEFNTIKIFKPTNVPEMTGTPTDILVYHDVGKRVGGIIYNGKRYQYGKDIPVEFINGNNNGNIKAGEYTFLAEGENGEVPITLLFDGGSREPSGRKYEMKVKPDGIYVDDILHPWANIKSGSVTFDPDNIKGGKYSFRLFGNGVTISFEVENGIDYETFRDELQQDGLEAYVMKSSDVSSPSRPINPVVTMPAFSVDTSNQDFIPGNTTSNSISGGYKMHADDSGIYMYLPAAYNLAKTGQKDFTKMTWEQLGLAEWLSGDSVNPDNSVHGEQPRVYTYVDSITGSRINFTVDSEVSKDELIASINSWEFTVNTNNYMNFGVSSTGTGTTISHSSHSPELNAYGTQYDMGRTMNSSLTLRNSGKVTYTSTGDKLSFTMKDAKNKEYTFESGNVKNTVQSRVNSDFDSYVNAYRTAYETYLDNTQGGTGFSMGTRSDYNTIRFSDAADGYTMDLKFTEQFSSLKNSDFNVTYTTIPATPYRPARKSYTVTYKGKSSASNTEIKNLTNNIYDALKNTSISVTAQNSAGGTQTAASAQIRHVLPTNNHTYSSTVISDDRKLMIQAGPRQKQAIEIKLPAMNTAILKVGSVDVSTYDSASAAIEQVSFAVDYISNMRSGYGAAQNRLEYAYALNNVSEENSQAAESRIRDADMAEEMVIYSKDNILIQATQSILAQNNQATERVLSLLQ